MIENTLELLLSNPYQLGAEYNLKHLSRKSADMDYIINSVKSFFKQSDSFCDSFMSKDNLDILLDEIIYLSMVYAYYFALDYLQRNRNTPYQFNCEYIKEAIPTTHEDKNFEASEIYKSAITQYLPFIKTIIQQKDPMHSNPAITASDNQRCFNQYARYKFHFSGQLLMYFQKIFSINFYPHSTEFLFDNEHLIVDLLPALTLMSLKCTKYLPGGTYADTYTINKIRNICELLQYTQSDDSNITTSFADYKVALNSKYPHLLYTMAREDLFHISRLNNTICHYREQITTNQIQGEQRQRQHLETYYSLFYNLPSVWFQNYCRIACTKSSSPKMNIDILNILPIMSLEGILFPQVLLTLLYTLFTDNGLRIFPVNGKDSPFETIIESIEEYIGDHLEEIMKHFEIPNVFIWDNPDYLLATKNNKGYRNTKKGKIHRNSETVYELIIQFNNIPFEDMVHLLMSSEPRWRYTTIIEENRAASPLIKKDWSMNNRIAFLNGNTDYYVKRYTSSEYLIKLCYDVLHTLTLPLSE